MPKDAIYPCSSEVWSTPNRDRLNRGLIMSYINRIEGAFPLHVHPIKQVTCHVCLGRANPVHQGWRTGRSRIDRGPHIIRTLANVRVNCECNACIIDAVVSNKDFIRTNHPQHPPTPNHSVVSLLVNIELMDILCTIHIENSNEPSVCLFGIRAPWKIMHEKSSLSSSRRRLLKSVTFPHWDTAVRYRKVERYTYWMIKSSNWLLKYNTYVCVCENFNLIVSIAATILRTRVIFARVRKHQQCSYEKIPSGDCLKRKISYYTSKRNFR